MWIAGGIFLIALLVMLANYSSRAREIETAKGAEPVSLTDRDRAYIVDLYERFGEAEISLRTIENKRIKKTNANKFGVKSYRLDDRTVLGKRLPGHGMLVSRRAGKYQLTATAVKLAKEMTD